MMSVFLVTAILLRLIISNEANLEKLIQREDLKDWYPTFIRQILSRKDVSETIHEMKNFAKKMQPTTVEDLMTPTKQTIDPQENAIAKLKLKWREFFKTTDFDNDGIITLDDRNKRIQIFINIYRKANKNTNDLIKMLHKSLDCSFFRFSGNDSSVTIDEYLNGMENAYKNDPHDFRDRNRHCIDLYMRCVDINDDGLYSWEEVKNYMRHAFVISIDVLKNDFIGLNPRVSVKEDIVTSTIDINRDSEISWEEYRDFRGHCSEIGADELNILKKDFLDLDPHILVRMVVEAWTVFATDDKGTYNEVQKEMNDGLFLYPME